MSEKTRREFLALAAAGAASVAFAAARPPGGEEGAATSAETPLSVLTTYITPNDRFFVRHWDPVEVDTRSWSLAIGGDVASPGKFTLADLARLPQSTRTCVLQCAGAGRSRFRPTPGGVPWGDGAVGNARWSGVLLRELLDAAQPRAAARHVHVFGPRSRAAGVAPFARSLPLEKAREDVLVAVSMNGEPLPPAHGGPARLVVPRWTGQHWMKWVTRLELHAAPLAGEYMDRAYRIPAGSSGALEVVAELPVKSVITTAPARARAGETVRIAGFAYSGAGAVARVEISDDGGATWSDAELSIEKDEKDPAAWRLWSASRTLSKRGRSVVLARATDAAGRTQPPETAWNPGGYLQNGWHSVSVEVA